MRGTVAKRLRKKIYGDYSLRAKRKYSYHGSRISNVGKRQEYQDAKKDYVRNL